MNKTLEIATTVTGRFGKAVLMIGFVLGLVWSLNSMSSFTQGAQNLSPQEDRIYQKLASDPQVLPALAQMKVMAKGCKLALPRPCDLMADRLQQQQP